MRFLGLLAACALVFVITGCEGLDLLNFQTFSIKAAGGVTRTSDKKVTFSAPQGAVVVDTPIIVSLDLTAPAAGLIPGTGYACAPTDQTFAKPVTMTIAYSSIDLPVGVNESGLTLSMMQDDAWVTLPNSIVDTTAHTVSAQISHFGTYGVVSH